MPENRTSPHLHYQCSFSPLDGATVYTLVTYAQVTILSVHYTKLSHCNADFECYNEPEKREINEANQFPLSVFFPLIVGMETWRLKLDVTWLKF